MVYYFGMLGIVAFSVTGVIAAGKRNMDIFSIVLLGVVTALGGGTLRDMILDSHPVFWIADLTYLWVAIIAAIVTFFCVRHVSRILKFFVYIDTFGMALFTITAMQKALSLGNNYTVSVLMGLVTGISGGMLRDVLTGRMPLLLGREFYATPALLGAILYALLDQFFPAFNSSWLCGVATIIAFRLLAIHYNLYYPRWLTYCGDDSQDNN
ncbi:trimeric intracellular cation channel family protein [Marinifilum sp. JC120]|nr:trimeric intracellular cation channel family protein [Marinifilum sp. JC120]